LNGITSLPIPQLPIVYPRNYSYTIVDNPASPFEPGTPCFSGTHDWQEENFDLSAFSRAVKIRFRFGSDGYVTAEGWYIDDVTVFSQTPSLCLLVSNTLQNVTPGQPASWDVIVENTGEKAVVDFWIEISPASGRDKTTRFLVKENITIPAGYSGTSKITFKVPSKTPPGNYSVVNILGEYFGTVYASDSFNVTVGSN
jgi:hypothetical protein